MLFKRKKHKLPKFPPSLIPMFNSLCVEASPSDIPEIRGKLLEMFNEREKVLGDTTVLNNRFASILRERCLYLIDHYEEIPMKKRPLAIGVLRYCAATEDAFSEGIFASGQRDDVMVMNHVLEELELEDLIIDIVE